jgi:SSS family solute:Na+ symporter
MAAGSMGAARKTPLIGAIPKMFIPFLVIIPGIIAIALVNAGDSSIIPFKSDGVRDFDMVIPKLMETFSTNRGTRIRTYGSNGFIHEWYGWECNCV